MAYTPIDKSDDYFNTVLYTGNASSRSITGVNFQPDWVWIKRRSTGDAHYLFDGVRGATKYVNSNNQDDEVTNANTLTSFDSDGFSLGTVNETNKSGETFVSWNWLAQNGTSSNTDGSITSTVSANTTSGFSIVSYTGNGTTNATVGHGLGVTPKMIITKNRSNATATNWTVYHASLSTNNQITLNQSDAQNLPSPLMVTTVGASTYTLGSSRREINQSSDTYIAYCFADVKGFSKFASYTGNGSSDGAYINTGFKPSWVMVKRTNSTGSWRMWDNKREGYNGDNAFVYANLTNAEEADGTVIDLLSNGFKFRNTSTDNNANGSTYIYMAFAENPFVTSTGIPGLAR